MRVGMGQMRVEGGAPGANLDRAVEMIRKAAAAACDVVVLPECLDLGWTWPEARTLATPIPGDRSDRLAAAAKKHGIWVAAGLTERDAEKVYNCAVLVSSGGELMAKHRKINELAIAHDLYDVGDRLTAVPSTFGRLGVTICADNFPESLVFGHALARMGVQILLSPCAWAVDPDHDNTKNPYGELWLTAYGRLASLYDMNVIGVSSVGWLTGGPWKGRKCIGNSMAVGPGGKVLAVAPYGVDAECLTVVEISAAQPIARGTGFADELKEQQDQKGIYIGALSPEGSKPRKLLSQPGLWRDFSYVPPGHLLFLNRWTLMSQAFDPTSQVLKGGPIRIVEAIGFGSFSGSQTGVLAYYQDNPFPDSELVWLDRAGKILGKIGRRAVYRQPWLAPDGASLVVESIAQGRTTADIWLLDLTRDTSARLTFDPGWDFEPVCSPDGSRVVFASNRGTFETPNLYVRATNGVSTDAMIVRSDELKAPTDWSRDGRFIVFGSLNPLPSWDIWILDLEGDRRPKPFLQTEFNETDGRFSSDGRFLAYASDETGRQEVYVTTFPKAEGKWQISNDGGRQPRWRRDSKEIFYIAADGQLMTVEVTKGDDFHAGKPKPLFQTRLADTVSGVNYDVSADGQRFLINMRAGDTAPSPITVVLNWSSWLKR